MRAIGTYEAKTHLPELLKAVETGETIVITRRGFPIARLMPVEHGTGVDPSAVIARIRRARAGRPRVSAAEIVAALEEGRKG